MYSSTLPSTSALDGCGWSKPRPGRFSPGKEPVPIYRRLGGAQEPVWTSAENLAPTAIRIVKGNQVKNSHEYKIIRRNQFDRNKYEW